MRIFDYDSPFAQFMTFLYELILLNIYFLATIIFTLGLGTGAGFTAMVYAIYHGLRREEGGVGKLYFKSLKENFKQVTLFWGFILVMMAIVYFNLSNIEMLKNLGFGIVVFQYVIIYEMLVITFYYFAIQSKLKLSNIESVKNAFIMAHRHLATTLAVIISFILIYVLSFYVARVFILIMFSGVAYIIERVILEQIIIKTYVSEEVRESMTVHKQ